MKLFDGGGNIYENKEMMLNDFINHQAELQKNSKYAILLNAKYSYYTDEMRHVLDNLKSEIIKKLGYNPLLNYNPFSRDQQILVFDDSSNLLGLLIFTIEDKYKEVGIYKPSDIKRFFPIGTKREKIFENHKDVFYIEYIFSFGKGNGQKIMSQIKKYADKYNVSIGLEIMVIEKSPGKYMSSAKHLERFYEKQNFVNTDGNYYIYNSNQNVTYKEGGTLKENTIKVNSEYIENQFYEINKEMDGLNFTSYDDAQVWMNENSKKFKNQNEFYASDEYRLAYPIIQQLYKVEQKSYAAKAQQAMVEANVKFGDKVNYDYITPFLQSEKYSGTIIERNGIPFVKLDNGKQTISGSKSVKWHKGWKKSKFENGGAIDKKDTLTLDVPLMIRLLELSREDIKSDAELHFLVEKLIELKNKPVLTMEDYAFIADLEHTHLKKFDLGGKVTDSEREVDLGFGGLGNGTTVWDRNRIENNDYKIVAHISNLGNITYYDKNLPENAKNKIEEMAMKEKQDFENQNGLSSGYEFMPINTPLN
jgi:hypothetical protein